MRTGVLSDQSILKHCAKYQPIPMHMTHSILNQSPILTTPYTSKKIKHVRQMSRPQTFDALATHLGKHSGSVELRGLLHQALNNAISSPENGNDNDNSTPATPATPVTPASVTPAPVTLATPAIPATVPPRRVYQGPGSISNIFSYHSQQGGRTQVPQTPGVPHMGALTTPSPQGITPSPQGINTGETRQGTHYLGLPYVPYPDHSPVQSA